MIIIINAIIITNCVEEMEVDRPGRGTGGNAVLSCYQEALKAGMAIQNCPELRQRVWVFFNIIFIMLI